MATTSDPKIYYPDGNLRVGKIGSDLATMAQSISDRIAEVQAENATSEWVHIPYQVTSEDAGFGFKLAYKLGPDFVRLRGTWKRSSGHPVYRAAPHNVIATLPAAITNRIEATTYFLAPGTGTSYVSLQCTASTGEIVAKGKSVGGTAYWCSLDNWEIPLAKV